MPVEVRNLALTVVEAIRNRILRKRERGSVRYGGARSKAGPASHGSSKGPAVVRSCGGTGGADYSNRLLTL